MKTKEAEKVGQRACIGRNVSWGRRETEERVSQIFIARNGLTVK
jgi:hypothetical protein